MTTKVGSKSFYEKQQDQFLFNDRLLKHCEKFRENAKIHSLKADQKQHHHVENVVKSLNLEVH